MTSGASSGNGNRDALLDFRGARQTSTTPRSETSVITANTAAGEIIAFVIVKEAEN